MEEGTWDRERLARVLDSLIGTRSSTAADGGEVLVELRHEEAAGGSAIVTIADRGMGVPETDLPCVFERLWRAQDGAYHVVSCAARALAETPASE